MAKYHYKCQRCHKWSNQLNLCASCGAGGFSVSSLKSAQKGLLIDERRGDIQDKLDLFIRDLEQSIDILFEERHSYPIWPTHNNRLNDYEQMWHGPIRAMYSERVKTQLRLLRRLRSL